MERVLVTGGAGYIGSILVRKLLGFGYDVVILDALIYSDIGIADLRNHPSLTLISADIRDLSALQRSLSGTECVIHLAAISNDPSAELDVQLTRAVNLEIYPVLLTEAVRAGVRRFINMSSIGVYGINYDNNVTEEDPINPLTEYSVCKAKTERIVREYNSDRFATVSLRGGTVCGWSQRMRFDLCANALTAYAVFNRKLAVWGGLQKRPQIHIDDVTDFLVRLVTISPEKIGGNVFNAAGQNTTVMQIAETINEVMGGEVELTAAPPRRDERTYHVSSEKIQRELGFTTRKGIRDAVVEIIDAFKAGLWNNPYDPLYHNVERIRSRENAFAC